MENSNVKIFVHWAQ